MTSFNTKTFLYERVGTMKSAFVAGTVIAVTLLVAASVQAQGPAYPYRGYGYSTPVVYHHSSTWTEGYLRGRADLARGAGHYNYMTSLAAINREQARSAYMDNRVKAVDTYFQLRQINRQARATERGPRPSQEDLIRFAKVQAPKRLGTHQHEPALGKVYWPAVFDAEEFATERTEVDQLMAVRTLGNSGLGTENHEQVKRAADRMLAKLKTQIREMSPTEYVAAKKFLTSLRYEAQFAPEVAGIASK